MMRNALGAGAGVLFPASARPTETKVGIVARIVGGHEPIMDVAIETGYSRAALCRWIRQRRAKSR